MKGKQAALFPGNEDKVGYWLTPPDLMAKLQAEFDFDFDACPYPRPAGFDGLTETWGKRTWCNPPFGKDAGRSNSQMWARKGIKESRNGKLVVFILPINGWAEYLLEAGAEVRFVGRVSFQNPKGESTPRPRWPSALFILRPQPPGVGASQPPYPTLSPPPKDKLGGE